jgi:hypothetical protein
MIRFEMYSGSPMNIYETSEQKISTFGNSAQLQTNPLHPMKSSHVTGTKTKKPSSAASAVCVRLSNAFHSCEKHDCDFSPSVDKEISLSSDAFLYRARVKSFSWRTNFSSILLTVERKKASIEKFVMKNSGI